MIRENVQHTCTQTSIRNTVLYSESDLSLKRTDDETSPHPSTIFSLVAAATFRRDRHLVFSYKLERSCRPCRGFGFSW